jgi:hypothetical protein
MGSTANRPDPPGSTTYRPVPNPDPVQPVAVYPVLNDDPTTAIHDLPPARVTEPPSEPSTAG